MNHVNEKIAPRESKKLPNLENNPHKRQINEGLSLMVLIFVGIIGVYMVGSSYEQPSVYNANLKLPVTVAVPNNIVNPPTPKPQSVKTFEDQLKIKGIKEAFEPLSFTIDSYDTNVTYQLDLGNGDVLAPSDKAVTYKYSESGSYLVELVATYNGQETILFSDFIDIYEPVEIVRDAGRDI